MIRIIQFKSRGDPMSEQVLKSNEAGQHNLMDYAGDV